MSQRGVVAGGLAGLVVGIAGTSLAFVLVQGDSVPNASSETTPATTTTSEASSGSVSAVSPSPSNVSSEGPPPPAPSPPPIPPQPMPTSPVITPGQTPATFACTVRLEKGPGEQPSTLLIVDAPAEVVTVWGVITSGQERTGGPVRLIGGRGEQVITGYSHTKSTVVMYSDPSMSPAAEACRSS